MEHSPRIKYLESEKAYKLKGKESWPRGPAFLLNNPQI
jgi:hypothetical protein